MIPLSVPNFEGNERKYADLAISQGWVSTGGAYVKEFEEKLASFMHIQDIAVCQSGTAGIHLSLIEAKVTVNDIVLVPALTFIAAVNPVKYQSAIPVFLDCDNSLCIDVVKLERFCEEECEMKDGCLIHRFTGRCVRALIVVHVFGNLADMETIMDLAEKYHITVIEDASEALGTRYTEGRYAGRYAGTIGDYGAFSFNGNKIITTGGGGAVTSKETTAVGHMRYLSTQSKDDVDFYINNEVGYNYRMTNIQAALGVAQLEKLTEFIQRKQDNYELYRKLFEGFEYGKLLDFRNGTSANKWFYSLELNRRKLSVALPEIVTMLQKQGVQTRMIWRLIHEQRPYLDCIAYQVERAVYYQSSVLNFPCGTQLSKEEIYYVAEQIKKIVTRYVK